MHWEFGEEKPKDYTQTKVKVSCTLLASRADSGYIIESIEDAGQQVYYWSIGRLPLPPYCKFGSSCRQLENYSMNHEG